MAWVHLKMTSFIRDLFDWFYGQYCSVVEFRPSMYLHRTSIIRVCFLFTFLAVFDCALRDLKSITNANKMLRIWWIRWTSQKWQPLLWCIGVIQDYRHVCQIHRTDSGCVCKTDATCWMWLHDELRDPKKKWMQPGRMNLFQYSLVFIFAFVHD